MSDVPKTAKQTARIDNWTFNGRFLTGIVTEHPNVELNGKFCYTSVVQEMNEVEGYAVTLNTVYTLGQKAPAV